MTMSEDIRCRLFVDESRIWNRNMANDRRLSFMSGYIFNKQHVVNMLNIRGASKNIMSMSSSKKKNYI